MMNKIKSFGLALAMFLLGAATLFAGNKTEKILVNGNCDRCEKRIETVAISVKGVTSALWNPETKSLSVNYDDLQTDLQKIQTAIAMSGHDTEMFQASNTRYAELPACCQYKRDENVEKFNHANNDASVHDDDATSGSCCKKSN